jgi:hypothetical protein
MNLLFYSNDFNLFRSSQNIFNSTTKTFFILFYNLQFQHKNFSFNSIIHLQHQIFLVFTLFLIHQFKIQNYFKYFLTSLFKRFSFIIYLRDKQFIFHHHFLFHSNQLREFIHIHTLNLQLLSFPSISITFSFCFHKRTINRVLRIFLSSSITVPLRDSITNENILFLAPLPIFNVYFRINNNGPSIIYIIRLSMKLFPIFCLFPTNALFVFN